MKPMNPNRWKLKPGMDLSKKIKLRVIGGRCFILFNPDASRLLGLKKGQKIRITADKDRDGLLLTPVSQRQSHRPFQ
jgi:hypothetical protein